MSQEPGRCLWRVAQLGKFFPLAYHEVIADRVVVYSGYSDRKAWYAFVAAGRGGSKQVIRLLNGVGVTFSRSVVS